MLLPASTLLIKSLPSASADNRLQCWQTTAALSRGRRFTFSPAKAAYTVFLYSKRPEALC